MDNDDRKVNKVYKMEKRGKKGVEKNGGKEEKGRRGKEKEGEW